MGPRGQPQVRPWRNSVTFAIMNNYTEKEMLLLPDGSAKDDFWRSRLAGAVWGGTVAGALAYREAFFRAFHRRADAGRFVGKDQMVMSAACVETAGLCMLVRPREEVFDRWFYMVPFLLGDTPDDVLVPVRQGA